MRVLLIKTSSMGDLVHCFPALSDAKQAIPGIRFDWLVEEAFAEIPAWHPAVDRVIKVAHRRWRHRLYSLKIWREIFAVRKLLRAEQYDLVLDAQGLVKSAWFGWLVSAPRKGLDWSSARESLASWFYGYKYSVNLKQHAVTRMRKLFALALGYSFSGNKPCFNLQGLSAESDVGIQKPFVVFLHGTTWSSKQWPESYWLALAELAKKAGYRVLMSGGSQEEVARANRVASGCDAVVVRPYLSIAEMASVLQQSVGAVAVDTGFGHLAAALDLPVVSIYGSTNPALTGAVGKHSHLLRAEFPCSPCMQRDCHYKKESLVKPACYETVPALKVWQVLSSQLVSSSV